MVVEEGEDPPAETSDPPFQAGGTGAGYLAIVDPDGDFDGDGTPNKDEIKDDSDDESDDVSSSSVFFVFLAIGAILIGSFMMLRRGSAGGSA